jgi:hypothetical protein
MTPERRNARFQAVVASFPLIDPDDTTFRQTQTQREESDARHIPRLQMTLTGSTEFQIVDCQ